MRQREVAAWSSRGVRKLARKADEWAARGVKVTLILQGRVEYALLHYASQALYGSLLGNVTDETGAALPGATVSVTASGARYTLRDGDVVVFRGDQPHSYQNDERTAAVGYSTVVLAPASD